LSGSVACLADLLYSLFDFLLDGVKSVRLAEDWFLNSATDFSTEELATVTAPAA
jgi:hypothetical protein